MSAAARIVALLVASAVTAAALAAETASPPQVKTETLKTDGSLALVGQRLGTQLLAHSGGALSGRLALAWPATAVWLEPLCRGWSDAFPGTVLLADLGVSASTEVEAFGQIDAASFSALVWVAPVTAKDGSVSMLQVACRPIKGKAPLLFEVSCTPPLRGPAPPPPPGFQPWTDLGGDVLAFAWEPGARRLWACTAQRLMRLDLATRKAEQSWDLPAPAAGKAAGPVILGVVADEGKPVRVGLFDLGRAEGRWYESGAEGFAPGASLDGLPLPERTLRFFTASTEGPGSPFRVTSYQDKELGSCTQFVRFSGASSACFGCRTPQGALKVIRGDTLAVQDGPAKGPVGAVGSAGAILLVASPEAPFVVKGYALEPDHSWGSSWTSPLLTAAPTALCSGELEGKVTLFAALPGGAVFTCPLPTPGP
jgi:hypothetical protein